MNGEECLNEMRDVLAVLEENAESIDRSNIIPRSVLDRLVENKFFLLSDTSLEELICRIRATAKILPAAAHSLLVHASSWLAAGKPSLDYTEILALSVTEPGGGTDLRASLKSTVTREGEKRILKGTKIFTSNAPYATGFIVLAIGPSGPTLYMAPHDETVNVKLLDLSGLRGTGASIVEYNNTEVRPIGTPGKGIKEALKAINLGRLGYGAIALGIMERSLEIIINISKNKIIFGKQLISYQGIKWRISEIYSNINLIESLINNIIKDISDTWTIDPEKAAIVKVYAASAAQRAAWAAAQILGGRGLSMWSVADRMQRDARALDIGEGAREVLLDYIANQAVKRYE